MVKEREVVTTAPEQPRDTETQRRDLMINSIREQLQKPGAGEKREMGFIEKSECTTKGAFFFIKAGGQVLKLSVDQNKQPHMGAYTRDVENVQMGYGMKPLEIPVVFVYRPAENPKSKTAGELLSLEFVPKRFTLAD